MAQSGNDLSANRLNTTSKAIGASAARAIPSGTFARFQNIGTMRTYLATQGYTTAQLDVMTPLDIRFATLKKSGLA